MGNERMTGVAPDRREGEQASWPAGDGDPSIRRIGARDAGFGALDEERSFGAPPRETAQVSAPAHVAFRRTEGAHQAWARAAGRDLTITQLTPGPCRGSGLSANLNDLGFEAANFDGDLRVRGVMADKSFSIVAMLDQTGAVNQWGHRAAVGDLMALPPNGEMEARFQGRTSYAVVTASWGLFMQRAETFEWLAEPRFWTETAVYSPPAPMRAACLRAIEGGAGMIRAVGDRLPPSVIAFLRQEMLDAVLVALAEIRDDSGRRQGVLNAARIIRRSEDFLEGGAGRALVQVDDLCRALSISRRTLYRAFHEVLDISPKAYLRLKAMSAARAAMLDAAARPTTVTQVALEHGFWELGRFAGAYRAMFDEAPSETLRRANVTRGRDRRS